MSCESIPSTPSNLAAPAGESHSAQADLMSVWELASEDWAALVPHAFRRISPTRAGLLTDQIQEILRSETEQHLVCIAAATGPPILAESVIAIALLTPGSDTATILHVDWVQPGALHRRTDATVGRNSSVLVRSFSESHAAAIWQKLAAIFSPANIRFVQWATDPVTSRPPRSRPAADSSTEVAASDRIELAAAGWPMAMNFTPIGTLKYLSLDGDATGKWNARDLRAEAGDPPQRTHPQVVLQPLDFCDKVQTAAFEQVIERTYMDSLDCPSLAQFRTPHEIIQGYRAATSFAPDLWYSVEITRHAVGAPITIGCILLARHPGPVTRTPDCINPACVVELVYMGILPEYRGQNYAQSMMAKTANICQQQGAERLILAVDETNVPALAVYRRSGMLQLFRETVWGRCVGGC